jgi:molybdopterin molybdotransferase
MGFREVLNQFFQVKTVDQVLELISAFEPLPPETVELAAALGRAPAEDVVSAEDAPAFDRSTVDGFAVRSKDTFGATEGLPGLFELAGEIPMGRAPETSLSPGQAIKIWTGGMLPPGADAVVMLEYARPVDETTVELSKPAAPYDNVIRRGEDVRAGAVLVGRGRALRPQDLGVLAALGRDRVLVGRRPRVGVLSTGDEVVPIDRAPGPGQIRDVNTYTLGAQVEAAGGEPIRLGLVGDSPERLRRGVEDGLDRADVVIMSGGSSVGVRDFTLEILSGLEGAEVLFHGVSVSPGKPTLMARLGNQSLWGLPGHTVSAMVTFDLFLRPLIHRLAGRDQGPNPWGRTVEATLARNVPSVHGRQDYVRVRLEPSPNGGPPTAHPILGKSGLISTMVKADGLMAIGLNEEGRAKGGRVEVTLFD